MPFTHYCVFLPHERPPEELDAQAAWAGFGADSDGDLLAPPSIPARSLIVFDDAAGLAQPDRLARALADELARLDAPGVFLDFERPNCDDAAAFLRRLAPLAAGRAVLLPAAYAQAAPWAQPVYCWLPAHGAFKTQLLRQARADRPLWIELPRTGLAVTIGSEGASAAPAGADEIASHAENAPCFFSETLCCSYCTVPDRDRVRLYLYDTKESLRRKLALARELGVAGVLTLWREFSDLR